MAVMNMVNGYMPAWLFYGFAALVVLTSAFVYAFRQPAFAKNAPPLTKEAYPFLGSMRYFTARWDFIRESMKLSKSGNFSFYAGPHQIVSLGGEEGRRVFFENKDLNFTAGYETLFAGQPTQSIKADKDEQGEMVINNGPQFSAHFARRLVALLKPHLLARGLPFIFADLRASISALQKDPRGITDPFDSIYRLVFQMTTRTLAANDIADDPTLQRKTLKFFENLEKTSTPTAVMYPWLPTLATLHRVWNGGQLYTMIKKIVDDRRSAGRRGQDPLQYLIDQGDNVTQMITFIVGGLFAGQINSGVNGAWIILYLANKPYWADEVRKEVNSVADRYCPEKNLPMLDRLEKIPLDAWENEFPLIDMCLSDSIRLQSTGAGYRKNTTSHDVKLTDGEAIPPGAYVAYAFGHVHYDPEIYPDPDEWDPSRYMPDRAEHKKKPYAWIGWGAARHPCLGIRFAKLEMYLVVAFFLSVFDFEVCDKNGNPGAKLPKVNKNNGTAHKPDTSIYLKYRLREKTGM